MRILGCLTRCFVPRGRNFRRSRGVVPEHFTTDLAELSVSLASSRLAPWAPDLSHSTRRALPSSGANAQRG